MGKSLELGNLDSLGLWVRVNVLEAVAVERSLLHSIVIKGANRVKIGAGGKLLKGLLGLV